MKRIFFVLTVFLMSFSRVVIASEFNKDGVRINFHHDYMVEKIGYLENTTIYHLTHSYGSGSPQEVVEIFVYIRDISQEQAAQDRIKKNGAAYESELSLAVSLRNIPVATGVRIVNDFRLLDISGNKAATATVAYDGSFVSRRWGKGVVINEVVYCITLGVREIEFKILALPDAPKNLLSSTIKAIEGANLQAP